MSGEPVIIIFIKLKKGKCFYTYALCPTLKGYKIVVSFIEKYYFYVTLSVSTVVACCQVLHNLYARFSISTPMRLIFNEAKVVFIF
jgi:hypothetical protein